MPADRSVCKAQLLETMKELKTIIRGISALALASLALETRAAATISYEVTMTGSNYPRVTLRNTSRVAHITYFEMTIGDESANFDSITSVYKSGSFTYGLSTPDTNDVGGADSNSIVLTFSGFGPGESISFYADIDPDTSDYGGPDLIDAHVHVPGYRVETLFHRKMCKRLLLIPYVTVS